MMTRIERIELRHTKHPSCRHSCQDINVVDDDGDVSAAALALAVVRLEIARMESVGSGGNIGCGEWSAVVVVDDAEEEHGYLTCEYTDVQEALNALPDGVIHPETVADLSQPVWDGSNHTSPNVESIAAIADCRGVFGAWEAGQWLADYDGSDSAEQIISDARSQGVYLDAADVESILDQRVAS